MYVYIYMLIQMLILMEVQTPTQIHSSIRATTRTFVCSIGADTTIRSTVSMYNSTGTGTSTCNNLNIRIETRTTSFFVFINICMNTAALISTLAFVFLLVVLIHLLYLIF